MSYQDQLVTIWQLAFHLLLIKPCNDNILIYGMQHMKDKYSVVSVTFVFRFLYDMTVYVFINWLYSFSNCLKQWKQHHDVNSTGFLTKETYTALIHTMDACVPLFTELF